MANGSDQSPGSQFAASAREALKAPRSPLAMIRRTLRQSVLLSANLAWRSGTDNFVRCLYGHTLFPEHRERMRRVIRTLKDRGEFIDTATLIAILKSDAPVSGRYFHLSFDDGFANVYEEGGPIFAQEQVPYVMFLATDLIGASFEEMADYNRVALRYGKPIRPMLWSQVRDSIAAGAEIGCHTRSHARLSDISGNAGRLHDEIVGAKAVIERETGRPCISFAWPFGKDRDVDETALSAIREAGFEICFSAERGRIEPGASDRFRAPRHQMEPHWPVWENLLWARGFLERRC